MEEQIWHIIAFLKYVKADLSESEADFEDEFVQRIQDSVRRVKSSREMEERFMIFEEMLRDERAEGKAEGKAEAILDLLGNKGEISEELRNRIMSEKDLDSLKQWLQLSVKVDSVEEFLRDSGVRYYKIFINFRDDVVKYYHL